MLYTDILIVGGGVIGTSLAFHLSHQHKDKKMLVVERGHVGSEASGLSAGTIKNAGSISRPLLSLDAILREKTVSIITRRLHQFKEYSICKTILCATNPTSEKYMKNVLFKQAISNGENVFLTNHPAHHESLLRDGTCRSAIIYPKSLIVHNPGNLARAFLEHSSKGTVTTMEHTEIVNIKHVSHDHFRYVAETKSGTLIYCSAIALCTGAFSSIFNIPVFPVKGQVWVTCKPTPLKNIIYTINLPKDQTYVTHTYDRKKLSFNNIYGKRLPDGRALFGGTRLPIPKNSEGEFYNVEYEYLNTKEVYQVLPLLAKYGIMGSWAGPMPFSSFGPPIIGEINPHCWIVNGFGSHGFTDGPAVTEIVATQIARKLNWHCIKETTLEKEVMKEYGYNFNWFKKNV
jgi:glycine/D-amino acid oxidase-like deaminating enzyme